MSAVVCEVHGYDKDETCTFERSYVRAKEDEAVDFDFTEVIKAIRRDPTIVRIKLEFTWVTEH